MNKLALLSTGHRVISQLTQVAKDIRPDIQIANFLCDDVVAQIAANGNVIPQSVYEELLFTAFAAERSGANAIVLTCSSVSPFVDFAQPFLKIPIYKIDRPMLETALQRGRHIGVLATAETTLKPTLMQLESLARQAGVQYEAEHRLCGEAFQAFLSGNTDLHDVIISREIMDLCECCDVVVLAQVSIASVLPRCPQKYHQKVLTSPRSGLAWAIERMDSSV